MQLSTLKFSKDFFQKPSICFFSVQKQIFVVENSLILTFDLRFELCKIFRYVFLQNLHSLVVLALRRCQKRIGYGRVFPCCRFGQRNVLFAILSRRKQLVHARHAYDYVCIFKARLVCFERWFVRKDFTLVKSFPFQNVDRFGENTFAAIEHRRRAYIDFASQIVIVFDHSAKHKLAIGASAHV